jgi:hypothetical protein
MDDLQQNSVMRQNPEHHIRTYQVLYHQKFVPLLIGKDVVLSRSCELIYQTIGEHISNLPITKKRSVIFSA